jgi:hypothetical protein
VAMLYLDVFDADGQWVRANVFVDERSTGPMFREGFIRQSISDLDGGRCRCHQEGLLIAVPHGSDKAA